MSYTIPENTLEASPETENMSEYACEGKSERAETAGARR